MVALRGTVELLGAGTTLDAEGQRLLDLTASVDGRYVVAGTFDGRTLEWERESGALVARLRGHQERVSSVAVGPGGRVITGSWDGRGHTHGLSVLDEEPGLRLQELERAWGQ